MTFAICWTCGSQKVGALTACANCCQSPITPTEKAKSLLLSDHHRQPSELTRLGHEIAAGRAVVFDDLEIEPLANFLANDPQTGLGCRIAVWIPVAVLVLLAVAVLILFYAGAYSTAGAVH